MILLDGAYLFWTMQTEDAAVVTHIGQQRDEGYQVAERSGIRGTGTHHPDHDIHAVLYGLPYTDY